MVKKSFIDVKSGGPDLSSPQKSIRKAVENGKIYFEEFRLET